MTSATLLILAVWGNNIEAVNALLEAGVELNAPAVLEVSYRKQGEELYKPTHKAGIWVTPLFEAERLGHQKIAQALKAKGAQSDIYLGKSRVFNF